MNKIRLLGIIPVLAALTACVEVVAEHEDTAALAGVYEGSLDNRFAHALISDYGDVGVYLPETGEIFGGSLTAFEDELFGNLIRYRQIQGSRYSARSAMEEHGDLEAYSVDGDLIEGWIESAHTTRDLSLNFDAQNSYRLDLPFGSYENLDPVTGFYTELSIDGSGHLDGFDDAGCFFSGWIEDSGSLNVRPVNLTVDCPDDSRWSGHGSASLLDGGSAETLLLVVSSGQRGYAVELVNAN